jgi:predicted DNA-binding helix-hairpin-helix protein
VTLADLARMRVPLHRARPFIITADHRPTLLLDSPQLAERVRPPPTQLSLFATALTARSGEL